MIWKTRPTNLGVWMIILLKIHYDVKMKMRVNFF